MPFDDFPPRLPKPRAARWPVEARVLVRILLILLVLSAAAVSVWALARWAESRRAAREAEAEEPYRVAKIKARYIADVCHIFHANHRRFPSGADELTRPDPENDNKPYIAGDGATDPWGKPYRIDPAGPHHNGESPDVWTTAPDGRVIGNW
jgi:Type II secretion system (T2SS), protein G